MAQGAYRNSTVLYFMLCQSHPPPMLLVITASVDKSKTPCLHCYATIVHYMYQVCLLYDQHKTVYVCTVCIQ